MKNKNLCVWSIILIFGFICIGCENGNDNGNDNGTDDSDEYYVKYNINSSTIYSGGKLNVIISSEKNNVNIVINQRTSWETIIGPVKKGFNATLKVTADGETYNRLTLYTQISVSKNGSPFALKKIDGSDTPRNSVQINYIIDY